MIQSMWGLSSLFILPIYVELSQSLMHSYKARECATWGWRIPIYTQHGHRKLPLHPTPIPGETVLRKKCPQLGIRSVLCFQPPDSGKEVTPSSWAWVSPSEHGSNNPDLTGLLWGCGGMTWKQDSRHTHTHTHTHWGTLSGKKMGLSDSLGWRDRVGLNGTGVLF